MFDYLASPMVFIATVDDDAEAVGNLSVVTPKAASWAFVEVIKFI